MFINKTSDNRNNISEKNVVTFRKKLHISHRELADWLQLIGLDIDKNTIQRIESGQRFVTDIELYALSRVFGRSYSELVTSDHSDTNKRRVQPARRKNSIMRLPSYNTKTDKHQMFVG